MGNLTGWDFSSQNLTAASFGTLASANFTGAIVLGANFSSNSPLTASQLYSTASYQSHSLVGIQMENDLLAAWDFTTKI